MCLFGLAQLFLERCLQVFYALFVGILYLCQGLRMALLLGIQLLLKGFLLCNAVGTGCNDDHCDDDNDKNYLHLIASLSDKTCSYGTLQLRVTILVDVELTNHPRHVAPQGAHGLHALLVLCHLTGCLSVGHVPVL